MADVEEKVFLKLEEGGVFNSVADILVCAG
jgi:hypothetical protein